MVIRPRTPILVVCCVAQFLAMLDVTIVNVALEPIRADLRFSATGLPWVITAYTLASAGFLLLGGRAADLFGRREVFVGGLIVFGTASLAGGLASEPAVLVAARAGQGLGGAVMAPTSLSILAGVFSEGPQRNRAFGLWGTLGGLGGASGALIGGAVTDALSWRWILLVNAPIAAAMALASLRVIPPLGGRRDASRSFDLAGALTVTAGLVLVTYGLVTSHRRGWDAATFGPVAGGAGLLAIFAAIEARVATAPLVPPRMLRSRGLVAAGVVGSCLGAAALSMWFLLSLYVQQVLGFSALRAGLTFAPMSLTIVAFTQIASRLAERAGPTRVLAAGMTLLGAGMLLFSRIGAGHSGAASLLAPSLLCASGIGCSFVCTTITANRGVREEDAGLASGLVTTAFQIGGSVGLAVMATHAFQRSFATGAALAFVGAVVALAQPRSAFAVTSSAGKNDSIASSETVTSSGVPNVVTVLKNASSPSPWRRRSGTKTSPATGTSTSRSSSSHG
jgi:EmrB/QacA subfamily drug resistance transporter